MADIEKLARDFSQYKDEYEGSLYNKGIYEGYQKGFRDSQEKLVAAEKEIETLKEYIEDLQKRY